MSFNRVEVLVGNHPTFCLTPYLDGDAEIIWGKSALGGLMTFGEIGLAQTFVFEADCLSNANQAIFIKVASRKAYRVSFPMGEEMVKSDRLVRAIAVF